jgi:diacylglycerol kinase family enzyme
MEPVSIDFSKAKVAVILNTASGSCDESAEQKVEDLLARAQVREPKIWCVGADAVEQAFIDAIAYVPDVLIVLGGDGTIRAAAEACTSEGPLLIALPGGTMNMLPKALYGERTWEEALLDTIQNPRLKSVSGGDANGRQYFISAICGGPTLWTHVRESVREGDVWGALRNGMHALTHMSGSKVRYSFSDEMQGEADVITVICPLLSEVLQDNQRALEAAVINVDNAIDILGLASTAAFGKWRDDSHVTVTKTKVVQVSADAQVPIILDGEPMELGTEVRIAFVPEAFKALVPGAKD